MRSFVKISGRYADEAKRYNCLYVALRFKSEVECCISYTRNQRNIYRFGEYYQKKHGNLRSVFTYKVQKINGIDVCCYVALRVFARGSKEYEEFISNNLSNNRRLQITGENDINWKVYESEIGDELSESSEAPRIPLLNESEHTYISRENRLTQEIFDTSICESKDWVEIVQNKKFKDHYKVAESLCNSIEDALEKDRYGLIEASYGEKGMKLLYARPKCDKDKWFLLTIGNREHLEEFKSRMEFSNENLSLEKLNKISRRAYPYSMLEKDKDFWKEMVSDKDSNFILSEEELDIVSKPIKFPLFLTGRAGSGKSTMLQYLFAEYFLRYLEFEGVNPPVYLSYSSNLIDNAKKLTESLFSKNHAYVGKLNELGKTFEKDIALQFDNVFHVFQQLIRNCIEEKNQDVLKTRFSEGKHIPYMKYRKLWVEKFGREPRAWKDFGPGLSWHIIRTYIKGWDVEEYLNSEGYKGIGRDNKSVSDDVFDCVYKKVWESWYKDLQEKENLWDDQDLVRYCLAPDDDSCETCVSEKFSAVFCDESQDFTRIEIEFILRVSQFSHRRIFDENTLTQLPFIFVGDEFQTLNPTGFSWNSLRSYFTERLIHATSMGATLGVPEPVVLTRNYRSTAPVVRLANRLQLLRQTRFGESGSKFVPQVPYYAENNADSVYCLSPENPLLWKQLSSMGVVLIIPSAEGQTPQEYIENSPLRDKIDFYEDGTPKNITIYNPVQAKGLEYPNVAVYGFDGENELILSELEKWYDSLSPKEDTEAREIELKYFLSNAYVAATRAKSKLFILTEFKENSFWAFAFSAEDQKLQERIARVSMMMQEKAKWKDESLLGYIVRADVSAITNENIVNAEGVAKSTEERAMQLHDSLLMRQAAARYREQGKEEDDVRCQAFAYRYEGRYEDAARSFEEISLFNNACDDYWRLGSEQRTKKFLEQICRLVGKSDDFRVKYAEHATTKATLNDFKLDLDDLEKSLKMRSELREQIIEDSWLWSFVLNEIFSKVPIPALVQKNDTMAIIAIAERLKGYGIDISKFRLAHFAYAVEAWKDAVKIWSSLSVKEQPKEYHQAQCRLLEYPENLIYREPSCDPLWQSKVVEDFRIKPDLRLLDLRQRRIVAHALFSEGSLQEAREELAFLWADSNDATIAKELGKRALARGVRYAEEVIDILFALRWGDILHERIPKDIYQSSELNALLETLRKIKEIRGSEFLKKLNSALSAQKKYKYTRDFLDEEFSRFSRQRWSCLLFYEMGKIMEKRGYFVDAQRFYEWAQRNTDDSELKKEMGIRWIVCKERQAKDKGDSGKDYWTEAMDKRAEIGVEGLEIHSEINFSRWEWVYAEILALDSAKKEAEKVALIPSLKASPILDDFKPAILPYSEQCIQSNNPIGELFSSPVSKPLPKAERKNKIDKEKKDSKIQSFVECEVKGYKFRYKPRKSELSINLEDEDLRIKIKNGKIEGGSEFLIRDSYLLKAEDYSVTPFRIVIKPGCIQISDVESGMTILFPMNS